MLILPGISVPLRSSIVITFLLFRLLPNLLGLFLFVLCRNPLRLPLFCLPFLPDLCPFPRLRAAVVVVEVVVVGVVVVVVVVVAGGGGGTIAACTSTGRTR